MSSDKFVSPEWIGGRFDIGMYPHYIYQKSNIISNNVFDIGAWNGDDAELLRSWFDVKPENVFCFEPNTSNFDNLVAGHPNFNNFHLGISNFTEEKTFKCHKSKTDMSSIKRRLEFPEEDYNNITIKISRMDDFLTEHKIDSVDICKIDVEGETYEVLEGFGDKLSIVKSLQIEAELVNNYENQKLFDDCKNVLEKRGFTMMNYFDNSSNAIGHCDSLWIRTDLLL